jgi:hypothetical protein
MPTVIIPDKICIKCGSNKWRINLKTGYKRCTDCANTNARKNYKKEAYKNKVLKNPELYRKISRESQKRYKNASHRKEELYQKNKLYHADQRKKLSTFYIKNILSKHDKILKYSEIPQDLIELKRKQILLTRQIRNHEIKN